MDNVSTHSQEYRGNGGYHNTCGGSDPSALHRANLQEEMMNSNHHHYDRPGQYAQPSEQEPAVEIMYTGPDDLEYDDEDIAPRKGGAYWKQRVPTIAINAVTTLVWVWMWSSFGFSRLLPGTAGSFLYWAFILFMAYGAMQSDHRAALYSEEREVLTNTESNLKLIVKVLGTIVTLMLTFKTLEKKSNAAQYAVYVALGSAFFVALLGVAQIGCKKRGESVRRLRKVKDAGLNLAIALLAVAALITFDIGTRGGVLSGGGNEIVETEVVTLQEGGKRTRASPTRNIKVKAPQEQIIVEVERTAPKINYVTAPTIPQHQQQTAPPPPPQGDQYGLDSIAPTTYSGSGYQPLQGAPTIR